MSWPGAIPTVKYNLFIWARAASASARAAILAVLAGCGVKGDPLPPLEPARLGRGRPTYRRATEKIEIGEKAGDSPKPAPSLTNKVRGGDEPADE